MKLYFASGCLSPFPPQLLNLDPGSGREQEPPGFESEDPADPTPEWEP